MSRKTEILDSKQIQQKIKRLAFEIYENTFAYDEILIGGIKGNGIPLSQKIVEILKEVTPQKVTQFDINIDKKHPEKGIEYSIADIDNKVIVLVDDVINSGKTMLFVVTHLLQHNVKELKTTVLVDRKHRRYPIKADFVGLTLSTTLQDHIQVEWEASPRAFLI